MNDQHRTLLRAELARDEGVRLKPYFDSRGKLTIGTGRNLTDMGISADENRYLLNNDICRAEAVLYAHLAWWRMLGPVRQRVMLQMRFNLGPGRLLQFKKTLPLIQSAAMKRPPARCCIPDGPGKSGGVQCGWRI